MTPSKFINRIDSFIPRHIKKAFIYSVIFGIICHFYMLTNKLTNHDDIHQLYNIMDLRISGRWFLRYASSISSYLSMPWVNGLLIITYISLSSALIVGLFDLRNDLLIIILTGLLITFTGVVAIMPYMQSADGYFLGLLFSVIGSYIFVKGKKYSKIMFIILNILSLAIYQIFLGYSVAIVIIYYLKELIFEENDTKEVFINLVRLAIYTLITLLVYLISVKYVFNVGLTDYQGLSNMGSIDFKALPKQILKSYYMIIDFFIFDNFGQFGFLRYFNIFVLLIILVSFIKILFTKKYDIRKNILLILMVLVLPVFMNLIQIMAPESRVGLRMLYPFVIVYILFVLLIDNYLEKDKILINNLYNWFFVLYSVLAIFNFIIISNQAYFTLDLDSRNLASYTTRLITRIEEKDFYEDDKDIIYIGSPDITNDFTDKFFNKRIESIVLLKKKIPKHVHWRLYPKRYSAFKNNIQFNYISELGDEILGDKELVDIINKSGVYPKDDSIFEYNGKIYVKFQNLLKN